MFSFVRLFVLTSLVVAAIIATVAILYRQHEVNELIADAERQNLKLAQVFVNSIWPRFAPYIVSAPELDRHALRNRPEQQAILQAVKQMSGRLPILKFKIYHLNGLTVFSTNPSDIGSLNPNNTGLFSAARDGVPESKLTYRDRISTFEGVILDRDLVESYVPVRRGSGPVEAVFELYTDVTTLVAWIEHSTINLVIGFVLIFAFLDGLLFVIVQRANRTVKEQYGEITEKNAALEREILERRRAQSALKAVHEELEQRVEERTRELTQEMAERKAAEKEATSHRETLARIGHVSLLGEMATGLAHELNQPLAVISGCAQFCTKRLRAGKVKVEPLLDAMEQAASQANRASDIIRGIRRFIRKEQPERREVDVNDVIRSVAKLIEIDAREHGTVLDLSLSEPLPSIVADPIQIEQVVLNLAHNGLDAMHNGVTPSPRLTIGTLELNGGGIEVTVRDEGEGIPAENMERIFEPLYSTKDDGLGMGLSICRSIVEAHGGRLWATSNGKTGMTLHFTIRSAGETSPYDA